MKKRFLLLVSLGLGLSAHMVKAAGLDPKPTPPPTPLVRAEAEPRFKMDPQSQEAPMDWIEPTTGHRVIRLSKEGGSSSLYFHEYAYSLDGTKLLITVPKGLAMVDLKTLQVRQIVEGDVRVLMTGRKTGRVFYVRGAILFATDPDTLVTERILDLGTEARNNLAINADETCLMEIAVDPEGKAEPRLSPDPVNEQRLGARWTQGLPMRLSVINLKTGGREVIHRSHDWLNHLQCSPTDPEEIMFCHEGPWHFNDRIWTIRSDGSGLAKVHTRSMEMEIAGHEFFSRDGRTVYYDLQTPRSLVFWLAAVERPSGLRTWYHLERAQWSVHYNVSADGKLFAGDGGGPGSVANRGADNKTLSPAGNGQWIYLFRPQLQALAGTHADGAALARIGTLQAERLVDLSKHDYKLEPNVNFTPDGKWIVFRSNMHGATHTYMVEVQKSAAQGR